MVAPMKRAARPRGGGAQTRRAALSGSWLTAAAVARAAGGELVQRGRKAVGITTDSRGDCSGKLFVALRGAVADGVRGVGGDLTRVHGVNRGAALPRRQVQRRLEALHLEVSVQGGEGAFLGEESVGRTAAPRCSGKQDDAAEHQRDARIRKA